MHIHGLDVAVIAHGHTRGTLTMLIAQCSQPRKFYANCCLFRMVYRTDIEKMKVYHLQQMPFQFPIIGTRILFLTTINVNFCNILQD